MAKIGNQGDGGGRPCIVLDDEQLRQVEKLAGILTTSQLADFLGVGRTTLFDIFERQPEVSELYKKGRAKVIGGVGQNLVQKALSGDNAAMMFYLKTQAGWKEMQQVDHTSSDGSMSQKPSVIELVAPDVESSD